VAEAFLVMAKHQALDGSQLGVVDTHEMSSAAPAANHLHLSPSRSSSRVIRSPNKLGQGDGFDSTVARGWSTSSSLLSQAVAGGSTGSPQQSTDPESEISFPNTHEKAQAAGSERVLTKPVPPPPRRSTFMIAKEDGDVTKEQWDSFNQDEKGEWTDLHCIENARAKAQWLTYNEKLTQYYKDVSG
jgi:hypothetical protein